MKTKSRLYLLLGVMLLLVTALAFASVATIWRMRGAGFAVIKANYNSITYMQAMVDVVDTEADPAQRQALLNEQLALQQLNVTEPPERAATDRLALAVEAHGRAPDDPVVMTELRRAIAGVLEVNRAAIVDKAEAQEQLGNRAVIWISFGATIAFVIAFTLFLSMPEFFVDPIRKLTEGIDRIAAGHYDERVALERNDEFGHMAERFNSMAAELERWSTSNLAQIMAEKARAEAVINCLRHPSIGVDDQQRILFMNRQAAELLGVDAGDLLGQGIDVAAKRNDLLAFILKATGSSNFKAVVGGHEQRFTVESTPIEAEQTTLGTVYMLHNVTPYLERDEARTMFLATISHELKTPLASTDIGLGLLERQRATHLTADQAAILDDLRKDHQRLVRIVSELLDMAQVETGKIKVRPMVCTMKDLLDRAQDNVRSATAAKSIQIIRRAEQEDVRVHADPERAEWVLVNVLANAIRYSPMHGHITMGIMSVPGKVELSVSDQGTGIRLEEQGKLFQRYAPGSDARHGTGLGLSIARELMQAMGGEIALSNSNQFGTTFILTFTAV